MRILLTSHFFAPSVGGIETASRLLATQFARRGHEVRVVTSSPGESRLSFPFEVVRSPSRARLAALTRWSDLVFQNNISLNTAWPLVFTRRPFVVTHQTWITRVGGGLGWRDHLKRRVVRFATNIAISHAVAETLGLPAHVVPNPYEEEVFRPLHDIPRDRDLIFVGRLVSDKGADLLLDALATLRTRGLQPALTLVGAGPEEERLRTMARTLGLDGRVTFAGAQQGADLARLLNAHRVLVVPSRWREPFGIVAVEGIACGCGVVGSAGGGLPEAIGPCGFTFANGSATELADALARALSKPADPAHPLPSTAQHLERFRSNRVADTYLALFASLVA